MGKRAGAVSDGNGYRRLVMPSLALALALGLAGCGGNNDSCEYFVTDVPDQASCIAIQDELDCDERDTIFNSVDNTCSVNGCLLCVDIDSDFDGDIDIDNDDDD